jgi:hypothetical protein
VDLLSAAYQKTRGQIFHRELLGRVRQLPGIHSAAYVKTVPLGGFRGARDVRIRDIDANVQWNIVSSGYFDTAGLPIVQGRDLTPGETSSLLVNEQMARRFWPDEDAIGKAIMLPRTGQQLTVVGVVRDGRMRSFREPDILSCI